MRKEIGILFNGDMVRAIIDGRKTQTRRIVKSAPVSAGLTIFSTRGNDDDDACAMFFEGHSVNSTGLGVYKSPFGQPGDLLYVRETWALHHTWDYTKHPEQHYRDGIFYRAGDCPEGIAGKFRPSIHMPKSAARIWLEVESVRVERLHDISEDDAKAEGFAAITKDGTLYKYGIPGSDGLPACSGEDYGWLWMQFQKNPRDAFAYLWQSVYGAESWEANPFVWAITFRIVSTTGKPQEGQEG